MSFTKDWFVDLLGWKWDTSVTDMAISPCGRMWVCRPGAADMKAVFTDGSSDRVYLPNSVLASAEQFVLLCHLLEVSTGRRKPNVSVAPEAP